MTDRIDAIEIAVASVAASLERLEARVAALETGSGLEAPTPTPAAPIDQPEANPDAVEVLVGTGGEGLTGRLTGIVTLVGRSLLVLAGAFLLRALTEAGTLPTTVGVGLGLAYAASWFVAMARAARVGRIASATAHGTSAAIIAYPLIWEATRSFKVVPPSVAVLLVAVVSAVGLLMAWRHGLRVVAWVMTVAAMSISVALMFITPNPVAPTWFVLGLGLATLWIGRTRDWPELPWLPAVLADLAVARITGMASSSWSGEVAREPAVAVSTAVALSILLLVGYLASTVAQVYVRRQRIDAFDVAQTLAVVAAGLGGILEVVGTTHGPLVGAVSVAAAGGYYWIAFRPGGGAVGNGRDFVYFSSLAMVLLLVGMPALVGDVLASVLWGLLAVATAYVGSRLDRVTLRAHAAVLVVAAALLSGLTAFELDALGGGGADGAWRHPALRAHLVLVTALVSLLVVAWGRRGVKLRWIYRIPLVVVVAVVAAGLCAEIIFVLAAPWLLDPQTESGFAMLRTGVMALGALALAAAAVRFDLPEFGWLVYPALGILGLKIVLQDLSAGGPMSIAVAFIFYGAALILGPKLLRSRGRHAAPEG